MGRGIVAVRAYRGRDEQPDDESHVPAGRSRQQCVVPLDMVLGGVHGAVPLDNLLSL